MLKILIGICAVIIVFVVITAICELMYEKKNGYTALLIVLLLVFITLVLLII